MPFGFNPFTGNLDLTLPHNLLSATHPDTTAASVVRGDLITGQGASAAWKRLAIGTVGKLLQTDGTDISWATPTGTGVPVLATGPTLVTPILGVFSGTSGALTSFFSSTQAIAAVSTDGLLLTNTTAATTGAQKWSPRVHLTGQGFATGTSASMPTDWIVENQPVQGAATPTSNLVFSSQVNGAGYIPQFYFTSGGSLLANGDGVQSIGAASANRPYIYAYGFTSGQAPSAGEFIWGGTAQKTRITSGALQVGSGVNISWSSGDPGALATDAGFYRDGVGILGERSGTTAQKSRLYNTFTTVLTVGEWFKQDWITTANQLRFGTCMGTSTGTARVASWDYGGLEASPSAAITVPITSGNIVFGGGVTTPGGAAFHTTNTALTDGVGASAGTITNAPSIGNPTKWIGINDNGTTRYIPAW